MEVREALEVNEVLGRLRTIYQVFESDSWTALVAVDAPYLYPHYVIIRHRLAVIRRDVDSHRCSVVDAMLPYINQLLPVAIRVKEPHLVLRICKRLGNFL